MCKDQKDAVLRLQGLADDLSQVYPKAGEMVAQAIAPVDEAIKRIGVTLNYQHYAELLTDDRSPLLARQHPFTFATDQMANGEQAEWALCAARDRDGTCGLRVSVCKYFECQKQVEIEGGDVEMQPECIFGTDIIRPDEVPLPIRVRILNVLEAFVACYEGQVREERKNLLNGSVIPMTDGG